MTRTHANASLSLLAAVWAAAIKITHFDSVLERKKVAFGDAQLLDKSGRTLSVLLAAPFRKHHWVSALNWFRVFKNPLHALRRYLWADYTSYPDTFAVNTRAGPLELTAYSFHDLSTINEVFCRGDYPATAEDRVIVDFGSNIGLSVAGFLTSGASDSFVFAFEPVPNNCERMTITLRGFEARYRLTQCAIADYSGQVLFDLDHFGRFGGIGVGFENKLEVECRKASEVIGEILEERGNIDILKIDIEGLEMAVIKDLPTAQRLRIRKIFAELPVSINPIADTHAMAAHGTVRQFTLLH